MSKGRNKKKYVKHFVYQQKLQKLHEMVTLANHQISYLEDYSHGYICIDMKESTWETGNDSKQSTVTPEKETGKCIALPDSTTWTSHSGRESAPRTIRMRALSGS